VKLWIVIVVICSFLLSFPCFAQDITGSLDIYYRNTKTESDGEKETTWQLIQNYFLNYSAYLTPNTTCNLSTRVNYSKTNKDEQTTLYPTFSLNTINEYFSGNASYNRIETYDDQRLTTSFWNLNMMSQMEKWPKMSLQYTHSRSKDHLEEHQINTKSDSLLAGFTHTYKFLDIMYNYMRNTSTDLVTDTKQVGNNHISRLGVHQSFLDNRLSISGEGGFNYFDSTITRLEAGMVKEKLHPKEGFSGIDSTPTISKPNELTSTPGLIDGDLTTVVLSASDNMNIGLGLFEATNVDTIYIYTESTYVYPDNPTAAQRITWAVYYSNDDNTTKNWTLITSNASFTFNSVYHRFEIDFSETNAKYFKVVYHSQTSISITEIEAYGFEYVEEKTKTSTKTWTGNFSLSARPWEKWSTAYHLSYYRAEISPQDTLNYTLSHGANITWELSRYFTPTLSYQRSKNVTGDDEVIVDTYSLNIRSVPFETLTTSFTLTHSETDSKEGYDSKVDSAILTTVATIWEGVDINWNFNVSRTKSEAGTESLSIFSDIYLRVIITRYLSWDIDYNQSWQRTSNEETTTTTYTNINTTLVYTPSSRLYGRVFLQYNKTEVETRFLHEYSMGIFLTRKIQLSWISRFTEAELRDEMTHTLDLNWNIGRHSNFRAGWSFNKITNEIEEKSRSFYVQYSLSF